MKLQELMEMGVKRVRKHIWADENEFLQITEWPWGYLVSPNTQALTRDDDLRTAGGFQGVLAASSERQLLTADTADDWEAFPEGPG